MKKLLLISFLLMLASIFISCEEEPPNKVENKSLRIISFVDGQIKYTLEDNKEVSSDHLIQIIGEGVENSEISESISLDGIPDLSGEALRVEVYGEIKNFVIIEIDFEQDSEGNMVEVITQKYDEIDKINNKVMIIDTYFSEGIPSGKMQWENASGKIFDYYFSQEGYGIDGEIIICE
jgi:hypothetical protein